MALLQVVSFLFFKFAFNLFHLLFKTKIHLQTSMYRSYRNPKDNTDLLN